MISTLANVHLAYPDLAIDKLSGTDPNQEVESFIQLTEQKIYFAPGDAPGTGKLYFREESAVLFFTSRTRW